ncbi:deoxyribose-phosphate aldolase [Natronobiforma cellulositropha]|uniref:deoxyribose-phosphate aldolase n=1 Tax=Natronobiforma cellulositropha TaxID=1679076 RepID=UPI0021D57E36|nr:deoxyribose-phosphate aldolase [Natronobiforma cellulositropha]
MDRRDLAPLIDHTVLGPETTPADVSRLLEEANEYGTNACIPPCYVEEAADEFPEVTLATVVGFPHGQHDHDVKRREGVIAWKAGADELDVVCNVGLLEAGADDRFARELEELVAAVPIPVKVILETALLEETEIRRACEAAVAADAAMVKTSTGFASGGATVEDVAVMSEYLPVKASGGIGSYEEALAMIDAGAARIGTSSGVAILEGAPE